MLNQRNQSVRVNQFSMVPAPQIPRSTFMTEHTHKFTCRGGRLVPFFVDEILPGDIVKGDVQVFARLNTLLFPLMDNVEAESFFFFVPNRLVWTNWVKMMGERENPADSISFTVPVVSLNGATVGVNSIYDYMGIPPGQWTGSKDVSALPFRAYNLVWHEWFRDQNLQGAPYLTKADGPDPQASYFLLNRAKRHDYFTSALPWPIKGGVAPNIPLAGQATVFGIGLGTAAPTAGNPTGREGNNTVITGWSAYQPGNSANLLVRATAPSANTWPQIYADLSTAQGVALNSLRLAVATQHLLELDARGGTRYTEILIKQFGVQPEDFRLQRPEYIGGGRTRFQTQAVPQTSATGLTGGSTPGGSLTGQSVGTSNHSFSFAASEHGYIIGLFNVRGELTYQQGIARHFTRQTRFDFYNPVFANLGEQIIRNDEIFVQATAADTAAFGYQERWAELRHKPSRVSGRFRSTAPVNIDEWHLAQQFGTLPTLNNAFIEDPTGAQLDRVLAFGVSVAEEQVLVDSLFRIRHTRPLPMFSVPGLDRF